MTPRCCIRDPISMRGTTGEGGSSPSSSGDEEQLPDLLEPSTRALKDGSSSDLSLDVTSSSKFARTEREHRFWSILFSQALKPSESLLSLVKRPFCTSTVRGSAKGRARTRVYIGSAGRALRGLYRCVSYLGGTPLAVSRFFPVLFSACKFQRSPFWLSTASRSAIAYVCCGPLWSGRTP